MTHPPRRRTLAIQNIGSLVILFALLLATRAQAAPDCSVKSVPQPLPLRPTAFPPLSAASSGAGPRRGAAAGASAMLGCGTPPARLSPPARLRARSFRRWARRR